MLLSAPSAVCHMRACLPSRQLIWQPGSEPDALVMARSAPGRPHSKLGSPSLPPCLQAFTQESLDFQEKVLARSGLGEETYLPECERPRGWQAARDALRQGCSQGLPQVPCEAQCRPAGAAEAMVPVSWPAWPSMWARPLALLRRCTIPCLPPPLSLAPPPPAAIMASPPNISMETARQEANLVLFSSVEEVLRATGTKPQAVDILIVNCSLFNPTPSLSGAGPPWARGREGRQQARMQQVHGPLAGLARQPACATISLPVQPSATSPCGWLAKGQRRPRRAPAAPCDFAAPCACGRTHARPALLQQTSLPALQP